MPEDVVKPGEIDISLRSIKSSIETGEVKKMYELSKLHPTKVITALRMNHGRYVKKLANPESFSIAEIIRFSRLIGVDPHKVIDIVLREAVPNVIKQEASANEKKNRAKKSAPAKKISRKVKKPGR